MDFLFQYKKRMFGKSIKKIIENLNFSKVDTIYNIKKLIGGLANRGEVFCISPPQFQLNNEMQKKINTI